MSAHSHPTESLVGREFLITREFDAPRELVFAAWANPKHLAQWWGPRGFTARVSQWDTKPGTAIHIVMCAPNGMEIPLDGEFVEVVAPEKLVFTCGKMDEAGKMMFEFLHTVTLVERNDKTLFTIKSRVTKAISRSDQHICGYEPGMTQSLERLAEILAADDEIVITHEFDAPRELVFKAWTDPKHLAQWWGPRGFTNPVCQWDPKPGNAIHVVMRSPNGTDYPMGGTFREVAAPEKLILSTGALDEKGVLMFELLHHVTFAEQNGKTLLTIRSRVIAKTAEYSDKYLSGYRAGMTQSLEKLAETLPAKGEPLVVERTFAAPVATVWKALTNNEALQKWFFPLKEFKPQAGFTFQFTVEHDGNTFVHDCKVTAAIPSKKLAYTWRYAGQKGDSLVTIDLVPEGDKTKVTLTHTGLETFPKTPSYARANFIMGWTQIIGTSLKDYVEKGAADSSGCGDTQLADGQ